MRKLRAGVRRSLSFERLRSSSAGSADGASADDQRPRADERLTAEQCHEIVAGLHGDACAGSTRRLLGACADGNAAAAQNRAAAARAGVAPALVGLLHEGAPREGRAEAVRLAALELLALLTEEPGDGVVHCQLVFVGLVEALLPLLAPSRRGSLRPAALANRLLLHLARTGDGLEGVVRDGAGRHLAALLAAPEQDIAPPERYEATAAFVRQFHHRLSSERLIEFSTSEDYAALLRSAEATREGDGDGTASGQGDAAAGSPTARPEQRLDDAQARSSGGRAGPRWLAGVREARDLADLRRDGGRMDPYVTVEVGDAIMRGEAHRGGHRDPTWGGEPFEFRGEASVVRRSRPTAVPLVAFTRALTADVCRRLGRGEPHRSWRH